MEIARAPSFKKRKRSKLGLLPLVALIFYEVSGGPFGTEVRFHEFLLPLHCHNCAPKHLICIVRVRQQLHAGASSRMLLPLRLAR